MRREFDFPSSQKKIPLAVLAVLGRGARPALLIVCAISADPV
uniref:Uncharacterized protein n=1 Tax=Arundo donax TaxID=35708 RepID=A0A0A8YX91_ARUDO